MQVNVLQQGSQMAARLDRLEVCPGRSTEQPRTDDSGGIWMDRIASPVIITVLQLSSLRPIALLLLQCCHDRSFWPFARPNTVARQSIISIHRAPAVCSAVPGRHSPSLCLHITFIRPTICIFFDNNLFTLATSSFVRAWCCLSRATKRR